MKFSVLTKTPDVLDQVLEDIDNEDERTAIKSVIEKFIEYDEYLVVKFDTETKTAVVKEKR